MCNMGVYVCIQCERVSACSMARASAYKHNHTLGEYVILLEPLSHLLITSRMGWVSSSACWGYICESMYPTAWPRLL
jgi:hypothetical protein